VNGVSRIDQEYRQPNGRWRSQHGWFARVMRGNKRRSKWFGDASYGKRKGKVRAREWVDEQREQFGPSQCFRWPLGRKRSKGNLPSGVTRRNTTNRHGRVVDYDDFHVYLRVGGRVLHTSYSVGANGVRGARRLAIEKRLAWEHEHLGCVVQTRWSKIA